MIQAKIIYLDAANRLCRGFMFINGSEIYNPFIAAYTLTGQNACSDAVLVHPSHLSIEQRGFANIHTIAREYFVEKLFLKKIFFKHWRIYIL